MVARFLVTTALEETWPEGDVPLLLLGEWCRLYDRKSAWEQRDAVVARYHWDDRQKLHKDYLYLRELYGELLIGDNPKPTQHSRIMKAQEQFISWPQLQDKLNALSIAVGANDVLLICTLLQ